MGFASYGVPPWNNCAPRDAFEAQFSVPYGVALVAAGVPPGPEWLGEERLRDPLISALARRVTVEPNPEIQARIVEAWPGPPREVPTTVAITARGRSFSASDRFAGGDGFSPAHRLDDEAVIRKFRRNAEAVLSPTAIDRLIETVLDLEKAQSLSALAPSLSAR